MPYGNRPISISYYGTQSQTKNANDLNQGDEYFLEILFCVIMETLLTLFNLYLYQLIKRSLIHTFPFDS